MLAIDYVLALALITTFDWFNDITDLRQQVPTKLIFLFVVVVALFFYVHGTHLRSCQDGQLT